MKNLILLLRKRGLAGGLALNLNQLHANYMDADDSHNDNTNSCSCSSTTSSKSSKSTAAKDRNLNKK